MPTLGEPGAFYRASGGVAIRDAEGSEEMAGRKQDIPAADTGSPLQRLTPDAEAERRRRRAKFLKELAEARELRQRVQPRRARAARMRQVMRMRTFRV